MTNRRVKETGGKSAKILSAKRRAADGPQSIGLFGQSKGLQVGRQAGQKGISTRADS
jgi:hypothetical protein